MQPFSRYKAVEMPTPFQKWEAIRGSLTGLHSLEIKNWSDVLAINDKVNSSIEYRHELDDEWQTPAETLKKRSGDCEDFAILKYALMLAGGIAEHMLMLIVGHIKGTGDHAFLIADPFGDGARVLDSMFPQLIKPDEYINLTPIKGLSGERVFWFGEQFRMSDIGGGV